MKQGWTYKKLGELCDILDSQRKPITKDKRESGNIPYYGATGCLDYVKDYIFDEKLVLLGEDGAKWGAGEDSAYIITGKSWVNNHAHALRPKRETVIDELLVYYLNYANLQSFITGVTVPKLNQEKMRSILIPLAPLSEQKAIVSRLDSAFAHIDALKANAEKQLSDAKALFQKALEKAMEPKEGWEEKTLGEVSISMADGPFGSNLKKEHYTDEREVRIIQLSNIGEEGWREENTKYTTFEHLENIKRSEVKPNDIVIAKMMPAGRAILCPNHEKKFVLSSDAVKVSLKDDVDNVFILYSINSPYFRKQVYANVSGSGRVRTSLTKLRDCILRLPPISEQQKIVSRLDSLSENVKKLQEIQDKTIKECDALKQAMLRQVFE